MSDYDDTNRGALFRNERQKHDRQPGYTGRLNVEGVEYWLAAWVKESRGGKKYFSMSIKPVEEDSNHSNSTDTDDDAPF